MPFLWFEIFCQNEHYLKRGICLRKIKRSQRVGEIIGKCFNPGNVEIMHSNGMDTFEKKNMYPLNLLFKNSYYPIFGAFVQGNLGKFIKLSWINQSFMQDERRGNYKYILILMPKATVDRTILWRMFLFLLFFFFTHASIMDAVLCPGWLSSGTTNFKAIHFPDINFHVTICSLISIGNVPLLISLY